MCSVDNLRLIAIKKNRSLSLKATIPPSARGTLSLSLSGERSTIGTDSPSSLLKSRFVQLDPRARSVKRARVERPRVASAATRSRFPAFAFIVTSSRTDVTIIHFSRSILLLFSFPSFSLFFFFLPSSSEKLDEREEETSRDCCEMPGQFIGIPLMGITRGIERKKERERKTTTTRAENYRNTIRRQNLRPLVKRRMNELPCLVNVRFLRFLAFIRRMKKLCQAFFPLIYPHAYPSTVVK